MKFVLTAVVALFLPLMLPTSALAQWDYGQDWTWNMMEHRAEMRRMRDRMKANRKNRTTKKRATSRRRTAARKVRSVTSKTATPPLPPYHLELLRDSYQDFAFEDPNGFKTNFTFTSLATGKTLSKSAYVKIDTGFQTDTTIEGVPAGTYTVRAEVLYKGRKYPAHLGTKEGSQENPKGGDFAPTFQVVLKPIIDEGGSRVMGVFPPKLHVRVIE